MHFFCLTRLLLSGLIMIAQPAKADWKNMYIKSYYASSYTAKTKSPTDKADDYSNICQGIPMNLMIHLTSLIKGLQLSKKTDKKVILHTLHDQVIHNICQRMLMSMLAFCRSDTCRLFFLIFI